MRDLPSSERDEQPCGDDRATVASSLDHLIGRWTPAEADEINDALEDFEVVDGAWNYPTSTLCETRRGLLQIFLEDISLVSPFFLNPY